MDRIASLDFWRREGNIFCASIRTPNRCFRGLAIILKQLWAGEHIVRLSQIY